MIRYSQPCNKKWIDNRIKIFDDFFSKEIEILTLNNDIILLFA